MADKDTATATVRSKLRQSAVFQDWEETEREEMVNRAIELVDVVELAKRGDQVFEDTARVLEDRQDIARYNTKLNKEVADLKAELMLYKGAQEDEPHPPDSGIGSDSQGTPQLNQPAGPPLEQGTSAGRESPAMLEMMRMASLMNISNSTTPAEFADVDKYDGSPTKLKWWLHKIENAFALHPGYFGPERTKTTWAMNQVQSKLKNWVLGIHKQEALMASWPLLKKHILETRSTTATQWADVKKLHELEQTKSVHEFSLLWEELCYSLGYDLEAHKATYLAKLKPRIRTHLQLQGFNGKESYAELHVKAETIDQALFAEDKEAGKLTKTDKPYTGKSYTSNRGANTTNQASQGSGNQNRRRQARGEGGTVLSDAEVQRRKDQNLCLYCGKSGHRIRDCRARANERKQSGSATNTGGSAPAQPAAQTNLGTHATNLTYAEDEGDANAYFGDYLG